MAADFPQQDEINAELIISGFECSTEELTQRVGLQPTKIIRKGDQKAVGPNALRAPAMTYNENLWILDSGLPSTSEVEEHLTAIINKLDVAKTAIEQIAADMTVELSLYGYVYHSQFGIQVDSSLLQKLASLHISIDVDVYYLEAGND